jgi:DNA-binding response OmpR family regulator
MNKTAKHVLIIDDQESMRSIIAQMLRDHGFQVSTAGDGQEGLHLFEQDPASFNLILVDVNMPTIDGIQFLKLIKAKNPKMPVILITAMNEEVVAVLGKEYKADGVIKKPFLVDEAVKTIERVIAGSR